MTLGFVLIFLGIQFALVDSYQLTPRVANFLSEQRQTPQLAPQAEPTPLLALHPSWLSASSASCSVGFEYYSWATDHHSAALALLADAILWNGCIVAWIGKTASLNKSIRCYLLNVVESRISENHFKLNH